MRNRGQLIIGGVMVLLGVMALFSSLFRIDFSAFCWPLLLIVLGVWLVFRPRLNPTSQASEVILLGDLRRTGSWTVQNEEFWLGVGDAEIDLTSAIVPPGQTDLHIYNFVGDIKVIVPAAIGLAVNLNGLIIDSTIFGQDYKGFLTPVEVTSENYSTAECRVRINILGFVGDTKVRQL